MLSVLHVDNNIFYKEILNRFSAEESFECFSVKTPFQAFKILKNHKIDIIITGIEFKEETGEDFIRNLMKSDYRHIPAIVLSSTDNIELKTKLFNLGILDYLTKDSFIDYLITYIRKLQTEDIMITQLKNMKIAVLDDNRLYLNIIKNIFQRNNINNVDYYIQPLDLLNSKEKYCIYLIDCILPNISGEQIIKKLRKSERYSVIMAISSISNDIVISNILSAGADDYIIKPFIESIFMARLKANVRTFYLLKQLKEKNLKLEQIVKIDGLTELLNHKYVFERLAEEIQRAQRYSTLFSIIMIDIDNFKLVNDNYGHQTGDEVLIQISKCLQNNLRNIDIIGRYGGEEFLIILPETNLQGAYIIAERLREGVSQINFSKENLRVNISSGIAEFANETPNDLIKRADTLLYNAKKNGRNRIELY